MILRLRLQKIYRYLNILDSEIILDFGNRYKIAGTKWLTKWSLNSD